MENKLQKDDFAAEIAYLEKRYPEVPFAKLTRIAAHAAMWQKQVTIARVCEWIGEEMQNYVSWEGEIDDDLLDEFRKAMEDEL